MKDQEVWLRFKAGSETDFAYLYRVYAPVMFRYGCKISTDRDKIKDALQQVFFNLWKGRERVSSPGSVKNYLLKSMRCELFKKMGRTMVNETLPENYHFVVESSYEANLIEKQESQGKEKKLAALLLQLPTRQREVIFLRYYNNLSYQEISEIMGIEQESVYKLTYKALEKLQSLFLKISAIILLLLLSAFS